MRRCDRGQQHTNMSNLKGSTENGAPLSHPAPGPFYYSGRVGPKRWLPRSSNTGTGPMGFVVKWFIIYPSIAVFGAGLTVMLAPFYGVFWVVRRSLWNRQKCHPVARCFPVRRPVLQWPASYPVSRSYGFVPVQWGRPTVGGGSFGLGRCV